MCPSYPLRAQIVAAAVGRFGHGARAARSVLRRLGSDRTAVTSIEDALMGALVSMAIVGGVAGYSGSLGSLMNATFTKIAAAL